jgi:DNA replication protein DnaC
MISQTSRRDRVRAPRSARAHDRRLRRASTPVMLDDIGYVQQNRDEMEVLLTFLSERYERRTSAA